MAGVIEFKLGPWYSSGGTFRAMAAGVMQHLLEDEASQRVKALLQEAAESILYLNVDRDFDEAMLAAFKLALRQYLADVKAQGPAASPAPDLHQGFVQRLDELVMMIERESRS